MHAQGPQHSQQQGRRRTNTAGDFKEEVHPAAPGPKKPRRRRRRTQPADKDKKLVIRDQGLRSLLAALTKMTLMNQQAIRLLQGLACDTILLPLDTAIKAKMNHEAKAIVAEAQRRRDLGSGTDQRPEQLGPPTCSMAMALLEGLAETDCGSANVEAVKSILARWGQLEAEEMDEQIQHCRVHRGYNATSVRLTSSMPRGPDRAAVLAALRGVKDVRVMCGQAPPGFLEEELQEWLDAIPA